MFRLSPVMRVTFVVQVAAQSQNYFHHGLLGRGQSESVHFCLLQTGHDSTKGSHTGDNVDNVVE